MSDSRSQLVTSDSPPPTISLIRTSTDQAQLALLPAHVGVVTNFSAQWTSTSAITTVADAAQKANDCFINEGLAATPWVMLQGLALWQYYMCDDGTVQDPNGDGQVPPRPREMPSETDVVNYDKFRKEFRRTVRRFYQKQLELRGFDPQSIKTKMDHQYNWRIDLAWAIGVLETNVEAGLIDRHVADEGLTIVANTELDKIQYMKEVMVYGLAPTEMCCLVMRAVKHYTSTTVRLMLEPINAVRPIILAYSSDPSGLVPALLDAAAVRAAKKKGAKGPQSSSSVADSDVQIVSGSRSSLPRGSKSVVDVVPPKGGAQTAPKAKSVQGSKATTPTKVTDIPVDPNYNPTELDWDSSDEEDEVPAEVAPVAKGRQPAKAKPIVKKKKATIIRGQLTAQEQKDLDTVIELSRIDYQSKRPQATREQDMAFLERVRAILHEKRRLVWRYAFGDGNCIYWAIMAAVSSGKLDLTQTPPGHPHEPNLPNGRHPRHMLRQGPSVQPWRSWLCAWMKANRQYVLNLIGDPHGTWRGPGNRDFDATVDLYENPHNWNVPFGDPSIADPAQCGNFGDNIIMLCGRAFGLIIDMVRAQGGLDDWPTWLPGDWLEGPIGIPPAVRLPHVVPPADHPAVQRPSAERRICLAQALDRRHWNAGVTAEWDRDHPGNFTRLVKGDPKPADDGRELKDPDSTMTSLQAAMARSPLTEQMNILDCWDTFGFAFFPPDEAIFLPDDPRIFASDVDLELNLNTESSLDINGNVDQYPIDANHAWNYKPRASAKEKRTLKERWTAFLAVIGQRLGIDVDNMVLGGANMLVAQPGNGLQAAHLDSSEGFEEAINISVIFYVSDTTSTAMPRYPHGMFPRNATAETIASHLFLLGDQWYHTRHAPSGSFLVFRQDVMHHGVRNEGGIERKVLFDHWQYKQSKLTATKEDYQKFVWMIIAEAHGEDSPEFAAAMIRYAEYEPLRRYSAKHSVSINHKLIAASEKLASIATKCGEQLQLYVKRARAKHIKKVAEQKKHEVVVSGKANKDISSALSLIETLNLSPEQRDLLTQSLNSGLVANQRLASTTVAESIEAQRLVEATNPDAIITSVDREFSAAHPNASSATLASRRLGLDVESTAEQATVNAAGFDAEDEEDEEDEEEEKDTDETYSPRRKRGSQQPTSPNKRPHN